MVFAIIAACPSIEFLTLVSTSKPGRNLCARCARCARCFENNFHSVLFEYSNFSRETDIESSEQVGDFLAILPLYFLSTATFLEKLTSKHRTKNVRISLYFTCHDCLFRSSGSVHGLSFSAVPISYKAQICLFTLHRIAIFDLGFHYQIIGAEILCTVCTVCEVF